MEELRRSNVTILYASQTGQAKAIANEIYTESLQRNIVASIHCLSLTEKKFCLEDEACVIFVVSTTGDGDPPETARKFFRRINKKTLSSSYLQKLQFTLLALGDSNYTNFCNFGKKLERRLLYLGAKRFYQTGYADDAVGLEVVVEPWMDSLWWSLSNEANQQRQENDSVLSSDRPDIKEHRKLLLTSTDARCNSDSISAIDNTVKLSNNKSISQISCQMEKDCKIYNDWQLPSPELADLSLKVPALRGSCTLELEFDNAVKMDRSAKPLRKVTKFHSAISEVFLSQVVGAKQLTRNDSFKTTIEIELNIEQCERDYQPGDTIGIFCSNDCGAVDYLLQRLHCASTADTRCILKIAENEFIGDQDLLQEMERFFSLRNILLYCVDIRSVPKKNVLRMLADYTSNSTEKRRLEELCSMQGAEQYAELIRKPAAGLIDILKAFPSCQPPVARVLEILPRLQPRFYSIASSVLVNKYRLKFIFNTIHIDGLPGVTENRKGLCTGWLEKISGLSSVTESHVHHSITDLKIPIFWRKNTSFRLPDNEKIPVVMIGPGTGIAPFIGFLQHRQKLRDLNCSTDFGSMFLFYGCRHSQRDFLYRKELVDFAANGILTKLFVSFSRDEDQEHGAPRYVQDNLILEQNLIIDLMFKKGAVFYICGDASKMARDVHGIFEAILQTSRGLSQTQAKEHIASMKEEERYLEDIWC